MAETSYYHYDSKTGCPVKAFFEGPHRPSEASFGTLARLPRQVIERILALACRLPEKGATNLSQRSDLALDSATTRSLALVSKAMGIFARLILWRSPIITRPSALLELRRSLQNHGCWGMLLWNLHIGGSQTLPSTEWPLVLVDKEDGTVLKFPGLRIKTSMSSANDESQLPKWCEPGRSWALELAKFDCQGAAITHALNKAVDEIDVEPFRRCWGRSGHFIGLERWATRLFELQGILDLYLIKMRRVEDEKEIDIVPWRLNAGGPSQAPAKCRLGRCDHYPRLTLSGWEPLDSDDPHKDDDSTASDFSENVYATTRAQVWEHLTRRGSALDQFDHPILFARCGFNSAPLSDEGREMLARYLRGPHTDHFCCTEYQGEPHDHQDAEFDLMNTDRLYEERVIAARDLAKSNTMPGLMVAASQVINLAEGLSNLSIKGTLDLCLYHDLTIWSSLRSASIGPLLPISKREGFRLAERKAQLDELENLRICGVLINEDDADRLAGKKKEVLAKLKRVQWEWVQPLEPATRPRTDLQQLLRILTRLQRRHSNVGSPPEPRLIEVRLHPADCTAVLQLCSPQQRIAFQTGHPQSGYVNRVCVTISKAATTLPAEAAKKLHENSRKWWEDCTDEDSMKPEGWMPNGGGSTPLWQYAQQAVFGQGNGHGRQ